MWIKKSIEITAKPYAKRIKLREKQPISTAMYAMRH